METSGYARGAQGVDRARFKIDPKATPKKQRLRQFSPDKREAIKKELAKLLAAGFIKEVYHPNWLANLVLIQKKNNNVWRILSGYHVLIK